MTTKLDLKIKQWPLSKLLRYANNSREHSPAQIDQIAASIKEFGFVNPCLVDAKGVLIAGHGRVAGAQKLGMKAVPAIQLGHLTDVQARALRIADNSIALNSTWNEEMLRIELTELKLADYPLELLGFDDLQLVSFMAGVGTSGDPEATPEPPAVPVSRTGDLWLLGKHRLLCGDATSKEDVECLMNGQTAVLMATDPPYGVAYDNAERPNPGVAKPRVAKPRVANDEIVEGPAMQAFLEAMLRAALPHMDKHSAFYFWHPMLTQGTYVAAAAAAAAGILIHRQIIWVKPGLLLGRGDYHWRHELCFYGWQEGHRPPFYGPRNQDTIWEINPVGNAERREMNHATPKPVALWDKPIANHTKPGAVLYEPFSGSGTQIIAAEASARRCFAMELEPAYCDVAVQRWQTYAKKTAFLESTGQTFAEVAAERLDEPKKKGAQRRPSPRKRSTAAISSEPRNTV